MTSVGPPRSVYHQQDPEVFEVTVGFPVAYALAELGGLAAERSPQDRRCKRVHEVRRRTCRSPTRRWAHLDARRHLRTRRRTAAPACGTADRPGRTGSEPGHSRCLARRRRTGAARRRRLGVDTDAGRYRLRSRGDTAAFGHSAGPQSWKDVLHPARARLWSADRTGDGVVVTVPAQEHRLALAGRTPVRSRRHHRPGPGAIRRTATPAPSTWRRNDATS